MSAISGVRGFARRTLALARAEVLHVIRDKASLVQIIVMPLIQLLVLSNVATFAVKRSPAYIVDFDHSPTSRGIITRFAASDLFNIVGQSASPDLANEAMLRGDATIVVIIPHDFERALTRDKSAPIGLDVNAEKGSAAGIVQSYAAQILTDYSAELGREILPTRLTISEGKIAEIPPRPGAGHIDVRLRSWYNQTLDYKHYMVPGILVALVTMIGTLLTAQNIAREKEMGTLEQLNVTPIGKAEFITAKLLPFWVLAMVDLMLGLAVARLVFGVPIRGSLLLLFGSAGLYLIVALAIGLWISTLVETQQQAMFLSFFVIMIYLLMSGLLTPIDSMPHWVQVASLINPVRHFVSISRAILVKGAGIAEIANQLVTLGIFAVGFLTLAIRQYRKRAA
ncbi:MAG TPA: ABC transporter permease [Gemmatimonadaceae bacterium]